MFKLILYFFLIILPLNLPLYGEMEQEREQMIHSQLMQRGIQDQKVLEAMKRVPRHLFVSEDLRSIAYGDQPLPIEDNQTISQPYMVALMTELLRVTLNDRVLEVGTGSGYQAAVLAEMAKEVYTIEILPGLARHAESTLKQLGYKNIFTKVGDGYAGWEEKAPFDAIIVTAAPNEIPKPLIDQLKVGGRMVIPIGRLSQQTLYLLEKTERGLHKKEVVPVRFVPMTGIAENEG